MRKLKKILCLLLLLSLLFGVSYNTIVYASPEVPETTTPKVPEAIDDKEPLDEEEETISALDVVGGTLDGLVGLFLYVPKLKLLAAGMIAQGLATVIAKSGGGGESGVAFVTPDQVLFNKIPLVNIDFFDFTTPTSEIRGLRENVANWYFILRNIAIIILLCILIYVGIRMATSTVASDEAKYKTMLKDWLVSFILVFLMHYIIVFVIQLNNGFVEMLSTARGNALDSNALSSYMGKFFSRSFNISITVGLTSAILYVMLVGTTIAFILMYIKRMVTVGFLILLAPIITITYSIDKMGDGKSQALDVWLKEFCYNILIQPFHCIIYLVFVDSAIKAIGVGSLSGSVLAIMCIFFIFQAEKIVRKIFGFDKASTLGDGLASAAAVYSGFKALEKFGGESKKGSKNDAKSGVGVPGESTSSAPKAKDLENVKSIGEKSRRAQSAGASVKKSASSTASKVGGALAKTNVGKKLVSSGVAGAVVKAGKGFSKSPVGKAYSAVNKNSSKIGMAMFGAAIGASTGNGASIAAGGMAGAAVGGKMKGGYAGFKQNQLARNEGILSDAYNNYADKNPDMTSNEISSKVNDILNNEKITEAEDKKLAGYVKGMEASYITSGSTPDNARKQVKETINNIQTERQQKETVKTLGKPKVSVDTNPINLATEEIKKDADK